MFSGSPAPYHPTSMALVEENTLTNTRTTLETHIGVNRQPWNGRYRKSISAIVPCKVNAKSLLPLYKKTLAGKARNDTVAKHGVTIEVPQAMHNLTWSEVYNQIDNPYHSGKSLHARTVAFVICGYEIISNSSIT